MIDDPHEALSRATEEVRRWVAENEIVVVCDFCARPTRPEEGITFVTEGEFSEGMAVVGDGRTSTTEFVFSPEWLACAACAPVVEQGDPAKLAIHALHHRDKKRVPLPLSSQVEVARDLERLYRRFYSLNPRKQ